MRPRTTSTLAALVALTLVMHARAAPSARVDLTWTAPLGCPDRETVVAEVDRLLRSSSTKDPAVAHAEVTHEGRWRVRLETQSAGRSGRREIEAESCEQLAQATAVILALMIDPEAAMVGAPPAERSSAPDPPHRPELADLPRRPDPSYVPEPLPAALAALPANRPATRRWQGVVGVSVLGDGGTMPAPSLGVGLAGGAVLGPYRVVAGLGYFPSRTARLTAGSLFGGDFTLFFGALEGCGALITARLVRAELCAGVEIEAMRGSGFGVRHPRAGTSVWSALLAGGLVEVPIVRSVAAELGVTAVVPFARPEFSFDDLGPVHRAGAAAIRLGLGASARF
jgi:hypothetical protein